MGITGLLKLLEPASNSIHVKQYKGKSIAIDAYCWLHRGAYTCSRELVLELPTNKYILDFMKRINMLISYGITPFVVFDGSRLPAKNKTEKNRASQRYKNKQMGIILWNEGNKLQALKYFQKAVNITTQMAYQIILKLKELNISYIVAPYEADAQLAYLSITNRVSAIISEDSDLLLFGCHRVLYKLNNDGFCTEINLNYLNKINKSISFETWNITMFRYMCILAGCDYLDSLTLIGLKTAYKIISNFTTKPTSKQQDVIVSGGETTSNSSTTTSNSNMMCLIEEDVLLHDELFTFLKKEKKYELLSKEKELKANYQQEFYLANAMFKYHYIYDDITQEIRHLHSFN